MKTIFLKSAAVVTAFVTVAGLSAFVASDSASMRVDANYYFNDNAALGAWQDASNWTAPEPTGGCDAGERLCRIAIDESSNLQTYLSSFTSESTLRADVEHVSTKD